MKKTAKISALILAISIIFSLNVTVFAAVTDRPTKSTVVSTPADIQSVTVNGNTATYWNDSNTGKGTVYIRATISGTEYNLQTANVVITTTGSAPTLKYGTTVINSNSSTGNAYTYNNIDLFNKAYTVTVGTQAYVLAAGLQNGSLTIPDNDPMRITAITIGDASGTVSANVVQNPYMGNGYYSMWTSVSYKVSASMSGILDRSNLSATLNIPTGASAPTANSCIYTAVTGNGTAQNRYFNLSNSAPVLKITSGNYSRNYYIIATDANTISIYYGIDFTEAKSSEYYTGAVKTAVDTLSTQSNQFFLTTNGHAYGPKTVTAGSTVMDVMHTFAAEYGYASEVPANCTYMATLNGIGEFDFGPMSGWMYTNAPSWEADGIAQYTRWFTPPIGGADYVLSNGDTICWFICTDYSHHPWQ